MARVTSKLQVTVPKAIADRFGIRPGLDIEWQAAGDAIRVIPPRGRLRSPLTPEVRLALFDEATKRQQRREVRGRKQARPRDRGWSRAGLYDRGRPG